VPNHQQLRRPAQSIDERDPHGWVFVDDVDARRAHRIIPGFATTIGRAFGRFQ
jgi:hypothetical protein